MEVSENVHRPMETPQLSVLNDVDVQMDKEKRVVKLTPKAFVAKVEKLQSDRKSVLTKATNLRKNMQGLMQQRNVKDVQSGFDDLLNLCDEAKGIHGSLMGMLPESEKEKHDIWFKAKMIANNDFISEVKMWVSCTENEIRPTLNEVMHDKVDGVDPHDSISNVGSKRSSKASTCSSVSSARVIAEADKAALLARMAVLKEKHALEEQEQMIRRKKEQLELNAMLAESTAKLAVLRASESHSVSKVSYNMHSQLEKDREKISSIILNPMAEEFESAVSREMENQVSAADPPLASSVPYQEIRQQPWQECTDLERQSSQHVLGDTSVQSHGPLASDRTSQYASLKPHGLLASDRISQHASVQPHGLLASDRTSQYASLRPHGLLASDRISQHASVQPHGLLAFDRISQHASVQPHGLLASNVISQPQIENQCGDIVTIMQRQNDITAALVQQQRCSSLPARDIPLFDGDPLQYVSFIRAFEKGVEEKASHNDCLYYLEQFTRGQPRELVHSCLHMTPDSGYPKAKQLLQKHFGNKYKIATAYLERALSWPAIKGEEVSALQSYVLFLRGCCNVVEVLQYLQELDMPSNMRVIISKLPFKLRERWRAVAHNILETTECRALFKDLVQFIERQVGILMDPLFGDIRDLPTSMRPINQPKLRPEGRVKGNIFATTVALMESGETTKNMRTELPSSNSKVISLCLCCAKHHVLEYCLQFKRKKHREKMEFLKEKELCFGCLSAGHMSRNCGKRLTCRICSQHHPTVLHVDRNAANSGMASKESEARKFLGSAETCGHTGAGKDRCLLSILPVQVKASKGDQIVQTYAFLDPGSSATFCTESLMQRLNLSGRKTQFLLQTMGQERVVSAYVLPGLEVSAIDGNIFYQLPQTLTQKHMPVSSDSMVSKGDLSKWPYLAKVKVPRIMANVELLIGNNAPKMLEPWEVINSCGDGPYAIRTALGWVINGPLNAGSFEAEDCSAVVNRISVCRLEEMLFKQYNHDFNERAVAEQGLSREDIRFSEIAESSVKLEDKHYTLKLPFKKENVYLPNNFSLAKQRILGLKRRFQRDEQFYQEYVAFVKEIINKGYAEKVPTQRLKGDSGKVWYIPHHGVRHPRKRNLRVVFDCGAVFKGTSLNQALLQGPNFTSTLIWCPPEV